MAEIIDALQDCPYCGQNHLLEDVPRCALAPRQFRAILENIGGNVHTYKIFIERADDDDAYQVYIGDVVADTVSDALSKAAEYYEVPEYDLVAVLEDV